ncbi:MAG: efflux RND transporter periplasmic adaptor subunit [Micromonosporaceae bacterium]
MRRAPLVALVAAAVLGVSAAGCEPSSAGISTDAVSLATVVEVVDVPASVTARAVATLTSPAEGTLATLTVQPGATVAAGDVVARVDSPTAQKRLSEAKAALAAARGASGRRVSPVDLSGAQRHLDQAAAEAFAAAREAAAGITDETVRTALLAHVDAAENSYRSAARTAARLIDQVQRGIAGIGSAVAALGAAQRVQAQAAVDLAKSTVDALTLRAPIAGVVQLGGPATSSTGTDLTGLLGAVAGPGVLPAAGGAGGAASANVPGVDDVLAVGDRVNAGTPVLTIVDVSELGLVGEVDETDVLLVAPEVSASVELDAAPGVRYGASVRSVDLLPTPSARGGVAYRIRLSLGGGEAGGPPAPTPRPGMSAVAHLHVRTVVDAVTVPASAVFTSDLGDTVWVLRNGAAVRQQVRLGLQGEDLVQVLSGVRPGQRIVVSGTDRVRTGQKL